MLKKSLLASAMFALTTTIALADQFSYIGGGLGITANTARSGSLSSFRGMPFNIFAGYGGLIDPSMYVAGELIGTVATAILDSGDLKSSYSYGASIIPGLMLTNSTLGFLRFGVLRARFPSASATTNGAEFGLGMQIGLTQNVDLRAEYDFIAYRSIGRTGFSGTPRSDQFNLGWLYKFD